MLLVTIGQKAYKMNKDAFNKLLGVASEAVPFGIYCVKKGSVADMQNIKANSKSHLKELIRNFRAQGYKVYYNGEK